MGGAGGRRAGDALEAGAAGDGGWRWAVGAVAHAEEAEGALLLEIQGAARRRRDPPDPPAQLRDLGPDPGLGQHPQAEGQRGRADIQPPLQVQGQRHRGHVLITELAVTWAAPRSASRRAPLVCPPPLAPVPPRAGSRPRVSR